MSGIISDLAPMTETEAMNLMLGAIGEDPITDISTAMQADVQVGIQLLKDATREMLSMRWQFNTEWGYPLPPSGQLIYTDVNNLTMTLNVFEVPSNLLTFEVAQTSAQQGPRYCDVSMRRAAIFQDPPGSSQFPMIFYDRANNREGLLATAYPYLLINPTWFVNFEDLPQEARYWVAVRAARQFTERTVNSSELSGFTKSDETYAYRHLRRQWGIRDNFNMLRTVRAAQITGYRPSNNVGFIDNRGSAGVQYYSETGQTVPSVSPTSQSVTEAHGASYTATFTVTNTGAINTTVALSVVRTGTVTVASPSPSSANLPPNGSVIVTVSYTIGGSAGSGTAVLTATNEAGSATGTLNVTAT